MSIPTIELGLECAQWALALLQRHVTPSGGVWDVEGLGEAASELLGEMGP